ncbi:MAG: adenylyltransferase/cytidyltransferase family protein [bacterium]
MKYRKYDFLIKNIFNEDVYNDIIKRWNEQHRYYHNIEHLNDLIDRFEELFNNGKISEGVKDTLIIAAFFHDVIYDPTINDNEDKSIEYFMDLYNKFDLNDELFKEQIVSIIECSKYRKIPVNFLTKVFWLADNFTFTKGVSNLVNDEKKLEKEFQFVDYNIYNEKRTEFLETCKGLFGEEVDNDIEENIKIIKNKVINIGVYAGSFNPFHVGHMNILKKSQKMFDKVIVAFGNNPEKGLSDVKIPESLKYIQTLKYDGLVTDLLNEIESKNVKATLIRGIRNGADLSYESNQLSFINEIRPSTNVVYIPCDKQYEHISSSAIRNLMKFNKQKSDKYIIK